MTKTDIFEQTWRLRSCHVFMRKNSLELGLKAEGRMKERKALYFMPNKSSCCFEKFRFTTQQQLLILDLSKGSQAESSVAEKMRSCNKYHQKHGCVFSGPTSRCQSLFPRQHIFRVTDLNYAKTNG